MVEDLEPRDIAPETVPTADNAEIIRAFEHQLDGSWLCIAPVSITTASGRVNAEPGQKFIFGQQVQGLDVAEYLEILGASFGS